MRILVLSNLFPPGFIGGYELGAYELARGLAAGGHDVAVVTSDYFLDDDGQLGGLDVRRVLDCTGPSRTRTPPAEAASRTAAGGLVHRRNLRLLAGEIMRFRPDRVLCFNLAGLGAPGILQYLAALGYQPVVFVMDNMFETFGADGGRRDRFRQMFGQRAFETDASFIFMSRNVCAEVEATLGLSVPRKAFVPGWFNPSQRLQRPAAGVDDHVPDNGPGHGPLRFVYASRVAGHKGIHLLLEAATALVQRGQTGFSIDVFGAGEIAELLVQVSARNLAPHVRYLGCPAKDDLVDRFVDYDALLFPTWPREPFGFVVCEAAAAGCIPVMTAGIGASEWFLSDLDCIKVSPDAESLAGAIYKLLITPAAERRQMSERARRTAGRFFGFDRALAKVEQIVAAAEGRRQPRPDARRPDARRMEAAMGILDDIMRSPHHG